MSHPSLTPGERIAAIVEMLFDKGSYSYIGCSGTPI